MSPTSTSTVEALSVVVAPRSGLIGAEVRGIDAGRPLSEAAKTALERALAEHLVVYLRGQHLDADQHVAFAAQLGQVNPAHPIKGTAAEGRPEVYIPRNRVPGKLPPIWHADHTYVAEPSSISILRAIEIPEAGGDTQWASGIAAYDRLGPALQRLVDGLRAVHVAPDGFPEKLADNGPGLWNGKPLTDLSPVEHPVVVLHPTTGRRSLFVNALSTTSIVGLDKAASRALLDLLYEHYLQPEHIYRHRWEPGDVLLWDNRVTLHYAVADYTTVEDRHLQRISLAGGAPIPAA